MKTYMTGRSLNRLLGANRRMHSPKRIALHSIRSFSSTSKSNRQETDGELQEILKYFNAPIRFAFGYGSGVYAQKDDGHGNQSVSNI